MNKIVFPYKKKAQFFVIDAIFAIIILITGYLLLFSNFKDEKFKTNLEYESENIKSLFTNIKGNELCDNNYCSNKKLQELYLNKDITNINQTLVDIFAELYNKSKKNELNQLILNFTVSYNLLDEKYALKVFINNEEVFTTGKNYHKAKEIISRKVVVFGYIENIEKGQFVKYGPYLVEFIVWEAI